MEELKKAMMSRTFYREGMPEEVMEIIQEAFDGIGNRYKELHCSNSSIREYRGKFSLCKIISKNNIRRRA